jgi:hypothetical protein
LINLTKSFQIRLGGLHPSLSARKIFYLTKTVSSLP